MTKQTGRTIREGAFVAVGQVLVVTLHAVGFRFVTEAFAPAVFGEATLMLGVVAFVFTLLINPLLAAHYRFYPEYRDRGLDSWFDRRVWGYLLRLLLLVVLLSLPVGGVWAAVEEPWALAVVGVLVVGLAGQATLTLEINILSAQRMQGRIVPLRVLRTLLYPLTAVLLALATAPVVLVLVVASALSYWLPRLLTYTTRWTRPRSDSKSATLVDAENLLKSTAVYGWPFAVIAVGTWISNVGDRYLIAWFLPTAEVGAYSAIYGLCSQPYLMLAGGLSLWLRPILFDSASSGELSSARSLLRKWVLAGLLCGALGGAFLWLSRDIWFGLLLAPEYHREGYVVLYLLVANTMLVASTALSHHLMAAKKTSSQILPLVIAAGTNVAGNVILIPLLGIEGAAIATAVSFTVHSALLWMAARRATLAPRPRPVGP